MRRSHEGLRGIIKDHYLNLPKELEEFNYYYCDGDTGHVIMAIPECLLEEAEKLAIKKGKDEIAIISGIGTRNYYRKFGYERKGPYMAKKLIWKNQDKSII